jgi:hypothetical protein
MTQGQEGNISTLTRAPPPFQFFQPLAKALQQAQHGACKEFSEELVELVK